MVTQYSVSKYTLVTENLVYVYGRNRVACIVILVFYCVQIAKCRVLANFQGLKVRGQGLVNFSSSVFKDEDFRRGQQLCS